MKQQKIFYGWWIVLGSVLTLILLVPAAVSLANLFQSSVTQEFGITNTQFALSNALLQIVGVFFSPLISQLLVRDFKKWHAFGVLVFGFCTIGYGLAPNIYVIYLLSICIGFGYQFTTLMPISMLMTNWFVAKRGTALSIAFSGISIGGALLGPTLTALIQSVGWRTSYGLYGAAMIVICLPVSWFVLSFKPENKGLTALGAEEAVNSDSVGTTKAQQTVTLSPKEWTSKPFFWFLLLGSVMVGISTNGGLGQFPPFLQNLYGPATAAIVITTYSLFGIPGKVLLGATNDRLGVRLSTILATFTMIATFVLMVFATNFPTVHALAFIAAVFFGFGNAIGTISTPLVAASIFSKKDYPIAFGYINSSLQIGMTVGSLLVAFIADLSGTYAVSWIVMSFVSFIACVLWLGSLNNAKKFA